MRKHLVAFGALSTIALCGSLVSAAGEEFAGPYPSWADVRRDYAAQGDGTEDDTAAIQKALEDMNEHKTFCVLYFPAGTYRLTASVKTTRKAHTDGMCALVGESPDTTILRWDGPAGGTILQYDAWYAKISRLTLDGAGKAKICLAYGDAFSTYNETSDLILKDADYGMWMATKDAGQAENAVLRCRFLRCAEAGVCTVNFNSMDIWAWNCRFEDCGTGMLNGAGNFHAYRNLFLRSKVADMAIRNLMVFALVENTSIGSKCFMDWAGFTWGSPTSVTGNRIIEPTGEWAIALANGGPFLLADNVIKSRPGKTGPEVRLTSGDQALIGNRYTVENAVLENGRRLRIDEEVVNPTTIDVKPPPLPGTPSNRKRKVFEVEGADAAAVQKALDEAVKLHGQRPVVHLRRGAYRIVRTLTVPAGSDVQVIGDGASEVATVLEWAGKEGEPLLRLDGPARATLEDFCVRSGSGTGILATDCDQEGGKVFADQLNVTGSSPDAKPVVGVLVDGVERSDVQLRNCQGGTFMERWLHVVGGPARREGRAAPGQVAVFCGATGTSDRPYTVEQGGRLVVRTVYHEMSGEAPQALQLGDAGTLVIDSTRFSYKTAPDRPLVGLDDFRGDFAMTTGLLMPVDSPHPGSIRIRGRGDACNALFLGNLFWAPVENVRADAIWKNEAQPPANAALLLCNLNGQVKGAKDSALDSGGFGRLEDRKSKDDAALFRRALAPLREARIWEPEETRPGLTNLRLHRVLVSAGKGGRCVVLRAGKAEERSEDGKDAEK
jgi:hypothetical protein